MEGTYIVVDGAVTESAIKTGEGSQKQYKIDPSIMNLLAGVVSGRRPYSKSSYCANYAANSAGSISRMSTEF